jgi:hypothetical protein
MAKGSITSLGKGTKSGNIAKPSKGSKGSFVTTPANFTKKK